MKKISINSPFVLIFTGISLIVLLLGYLTNGITTELFFCTYKDSILNPLMYLRLFTHILGHADFEHWIGNMLYFLILGPMLEEKYGTKNLTIMVLFCSFVTGIINNIVSPYGLYGASGIVFMFILLSSITNKEEGKIPLTFILVAILYIGSEVFSCFTNDEISQMAHIIGGLVGSLFGFILNKKNIK